MSVGGGLGALQFFGHLKRVLELLISVPMSRSKSGFLCIYSYQNLVF